MLDLLWTVPAFPFAGFLILLLLGGRLGKGTIATIGAGSVGLAAVSAIGVASAFLGGAPAAGAFRQSLWSWIRVGSFQPEFALHLDPLAVVMILVVTVIGFLIHLYSTGYMQDDPSYARFFASMNLFVGSMLALVLADDLLFLYLGWEGVGLCSYLLIGFWYEDPENERAARKAFLVTRIGDAAMAVGLFLLFTRLGTLRIEEVLQLAEGRWAVGAAPAVAAAFLLLGGAVGKSAQLPLQTWLPDAMAGPTPVSALIHAATMVTAGVYLIARMHPLFVLAPAAMTAVAVIGAATLLIAGFSALAQRDIKRVLAYSTISQIGYMFLALGVGAWSAGIFHLMTHACFKALLFLGAGVVSLSLHHERDIFRMGGLRQKLPVTFWTFLIAGGALAGFPLVTAGFFSKEWILTEAWISPHGSPWLWAAGILGAFVTAVYIFRLIFLVFTGPAPAEAHREEGGRMLLPLAVLGALSVAVGWLEIPAALGGFKPFGRFLEGSFPAAAGAHHAGAGLEATLLVVASLVSLGGIGLAWIWYGRPERRVVEERDTPGVPAGLARFWLAGWGFDRLYDLLFVRPLAATARALRSELIDLVYRGFVAMLGLTNLLLRMTQTGRLRWYAAAIAGGAALVLFLVVFR